MRINIRPQDCKFYVNKEKRTIACVFNDAKYLLLDFVFDNDLPCDNLELPSRFVGIATCAPDDEWNEQLGKQIAFHRMKQNLHRSFFNHANKYVNRIDCLLSALITDLNSYGEALSRTMDYREKSIKEQLKK